MTDFSGTRERGIKGRAHRCVCTRNARRAPICEPRPFRALTHTHMHTHRSPARAFPRDGEMRFAPVTPRIRAPVCGDHPFAATTRRQRDVGPSAAPPPAFSYSVVRSEAKIAIVRNADAATVIGSVAIKGSPLYQGLIQPRSRSSCENPPPFAREESSCLREIGIRYFSEMFFSTVQ